MYPTKYFLLFLVFLGILLLGSCATNKNIAYFQKLGNKTDSVKVQDHSPKHTKNIKSTDKSKELTGNIPVKPKSTGTITYKPEKNSSGVYDAHIKPKDILSITVVSSEPEASRMYNLVVPQIADASNQNSVFTTPTLQTYLVNKDGYINFPVFGKIKVEGMTRDELEAMLLDKMSFAFGKEKPIITIRFVNFSINILGEVLKPGKYESLNDRLTIFEGIALAGDLTIYGRRENVKVMRENADGSKEFFTLNLIDKNIIYSPAFYLEQNDVVYVEPNKSRSKSSNYGAAESYGITSLSVLLTLTSLVFTVFKIKL